MSQIVMNEGAMNGVVISAEKSAVSQFKSMESKSQVSQSATMRSSTTSSSSHFSAEKTSSFSSTQSLSQSQTLSQSTASLFSASSGVSSMSQFSQSTASLNSTSSAISSTQSLSQSSASLAAIESSAVAIESSGSSAKIEKQAIVAHAVTHTPSLTLSETLEQSTESHSYETHSNTYRLVTECSGLSLVHRSGSIDSGAESDDGILYVRQFDLAPSPVKEIKLYTCVTKDPPVEFVIPLHQRKIHTVNASLITMEKVELKLEKEVIPVDEDEGMFEEFWEEVRTTHYEEEQRRASYRRMQHEERIEETRRTQEKRQQLLRRIEETKGMYRYSSGGRSYSSLSSIDSPYSVRTVESPYSFA